MLTEEKVYSTATSQEQYLKFFQDLFKFANSARKNTNSQLPQASIFFLLILVATNGASSSSAPDPHKPKLMIQLERLLPNEPPHVAAHVTREWKILDAQTRMLLRSMEVPVADQAFKDMRLQQDEFENKLTEFINDFRRTPE